MVASVVDKRFEFEFRADPIFVGYAVEITRLVLQYHEIRGGEDMLIVLTEILRTVMLDEPGVRAGKPIRVRVDLEPNDCYTLIVEDSGPSLDQLRYIEPAESNTQCSVCGIGRSLSLIRALADKILVSERGNSVLVSGHFTPDFPGFHRGGPVE